MLNTPQDTTDTGRSARLEARVSMTQKSLLQRAAQLSGRSRSEFVVASAQEAAAKVILAHDSIHLSKVEQTAFVRALLDPPGPSARLRQAAETYRQQLGL